MITSHAHSKRTSSTSKLVTKLDHHNLTRYSLQEFFFYEQSTRYTLTTACIFSKLSSAHFVWHEQGEFFKQSKPSLVSDHFLYSHDTDV